MGFDPVAFDTIGVQIASRLIEAEGRNPDSTVGQASLWLETGAKLGLGTNDMDYIEWLEVEF